MFNYSMELNIFGMPSHEVMLFDNFIIFSSKYDIMRYATAFFWHCTVRHPDKNQNGQSVLGNVYQTRAFLFK